MPVATTDPFASPTTMPIDPDRIERILELTSRPSSEEVHAVLEAALELQGLSPEQAAVLLLADPSDEAPIFAAAGQVKDRIYGNRIVLFAPLYVSNVCSNNCLYCSFRRDNREIQRRVLSLDEIADQVRILEDMGHRRLLLEAGEVPHANQLDFILEAIETIYATRTETGSIRRVNVNIAATTVEAYARLKEAGIGTYQLFQESYHRPTYERMHPYGPKRDYLYHLTAMDRAMRGGIDDVGLGVLFGLYDYRFEVLAMLCHAEYLELEYGVGPHTLSVPRFRPADGVDFEPPNPVTDAEFKRIVAVLRLAVPYTGIILSTRESAQLRNELISLGVSQMSAGSATQPGGYRRGESAGEQFHKADERSLDEVVRDICQLGYLPSFCTSCYRSGRTGERFMHLAKPGDIQKLCRPNAVATFEEYLQDFASLETRTEGERIIAHQLQQIEQDTVRTSTERMLERVRSGERDLYV